MLRGLFKNTEDTHMIIDEDDNGKSVNKRLGEGKEKSVIITTIH